MTDPIQDEWNRMVRDSRKAPAPPPAEPPPPPSHEQRRKWVLPTLFVLCLAALVLHLHGTLAPWPARPSPEEIDAGQKASLQLVSKAIHDYAAFHGKYPQTIAEVLPLTVHIDYRLTADGFELKMVGPDGTPMVVRGK